MLLVARPVVVWLDIIAVDHLTVEIVGAVLRLLIRSCPSGFRGRTLRGQRGVRTCALVAFSRGWGGFMTARVCGAKVRDQGAFALSVFEL